MKVRDIYKRHLSSSERFFLLFNEAGPPFVNQYILEGEGELDKRKSQKAVKDASASNFGMQMALKGVLRFSVWEDTGNSPPVREVDGNSWDGFGPEGATFLYDRLDPYKGPTAEVVLIHGHKQTRCQMK